MPVQEESSRGAPINPREETIGEFARAGYASFMPGSRWTSFVAPEAGRGRVVRQLQEEKHPQHRLRVEHDAKTLLIHLSDEEGPGWTTIAVDRVTRRVAVERGLRQMDAAVAAYGALDRKRGKRR